MREPPFTLDRRRMLAGGAAAGAVLLSGSQAATAVERAPGFTGDIRLPGLLHAVVARPPVRGVRLTWLDASRAVSMHGVTHVIGLPPAEGSALERLGGVAVLARDTWTALRARDALDIDWSEASDTTETGGSRQDFTPETAEPLMEPPSAVVRAGAGTCIAWACLREPERARAGLAARLGHDIAAVTLHATRPAAGPERTSDPGYLFEAARLSRAAGGAPVSLVWTRADDLPFARVA